MLYTPISSALHFQVLQKIYVTNKLLHNTEYLIVSQCACTFWSARDTSSFWAQKLKKNLFPESDYSALITCWNTANSFSNHIPHFSSPAEALALAQNIFHCLRLCGPVFRTQINPGMIAQEYKCCFCCFNERIPTHSVIYLRTRFYHCLEAWAWKCIQ